MSQENNKEQELSVEDKLQNLVKIYHKTFKEYEDTYDTINKKDDVMAILMPYIESGDFDPNNLELKEAIKNYLKVYAQYPQDVSFYATKFMNATDLFLNVSDKKLEDAIYSDYIKLKRTEYKPNFSIKNGAFVKNTSGSLPEIPDEQFEILYDSIKRMIKN